MMKILPITSDKVTFSALPSALTLPSGDPLNALLWLPRSQGKIHSKSEATCTQTTMLAGFKRLLALCTPAGTRQLLLDSLTLTSSSSSPNPKTPLLPCPQCLNLAQPSPQPAFCSWPQSHRPHPLLSGPSQRSQTWRCSGRPT